jgi:hypothetical protein
VIGALIERAWQALFIQVPKTRREIAVERARAMALVKSLYILGAGGRDPKAKTPLTKRLGKWGSDCIGFVLWCLGHDRYQPETFELYDGWINTDSLMMDAKGARSWYAPVAIPEPGDVVVFPSIYKDGKRIRMGHIGLVVEVPADMPENVYGLPAAERRAWLAKVIVIDCAAASARKPYAISETTAAASWDKSDAMFARCVREP